MTTTPATEPLLRAEDVRPPDQVTELGDVIAVEVLRRTSYDQITVFY